MFKAREFTLAGTLPIPCGGEDMQCLQEQPSGLEHSWWCRPPLSQMVGFQEPVVPGTTSAFNRLELSTQSHLKLMCMSLWQWNEHCWRKYYVVTACLVLQKLTLSMQLLQDLVDVSHKRHHCCSGSNLGPVSPVHTIC